MKTQLKIVALLSFYIFAFSGSMMAQKNYKWDKKVDPAPPIPEAFKEADAVMIYDMEKRQTYLEDYRFFSRNIIKRRIKIQTQQGLEKYARIILPKKSGMNITILDARTIKEDGTIVDLDAKTDIKAIALSDEDDLLDKTRYNVFSVPGVAVGDEIEVVSIHEGFHIERGATVVLHDFIPILKSEFSVETFNKGIRIMSTNRNGMVQPVADKSLRNLKLTWHGKNLPGLYEERGNITTISLPHFIYELNLDRLYKDSAPPNIKSWSELLHYINDEFFEVRIRKTRKFDEVYNTIIGTAKSTSQIDQLTAIQNYLNDIKIITIPDNEASEGIEYFLAKKEADYNTHIKMYKSLLDKMGVEYRVAAGRSKYVGPIDLTFPTYLQITDYLFLLPDKRGNSILLATKSKKRSYGINEVPIELYNTDVYMINPKDKELFQAVSLTGPNQQKNLRLRKLKSTVQLSEGVIHYEAEETISGALSTRYRNNHYDWLENESLKEYLQDYLEDQDIAAIDTFYLSERPERSPYRYKLHYDYHTNNQITELEDKVYKISLANFLPHTIQKANANRLIDYYPPHSYTDGYNYYLQFDQAIKLSNKENIRLKTENEVGYFAISATQMDPKTVLVKSKYIMIVDHIPVDKIQQLIELSELAEKADNEGLIVEILD